MNLAPALLAPPNLVAIFLDKEGHEIAVPVVAFDQRGYAMALAPDRGRLVAVDFEQSFVRVQWE